MSNVIKPTVSLIGKDGNIFNLLSIASKALQRVGQSDNAEEMAGKVFSSGSYEEALSIIREYCDIE